MNLTAVIGTVVLVAFLLVGWARQEKEWNKNQ
jgi:FtsZ-interacting cell division protein ZipA